MLNILFRSNSGTDAVTTNKIDRENGDLLRNVYDHYFYAQDEA